MRYIFSVVLVCCLSLPAWSVDNNVNGKSQELEFLFGLAKEDPKSALQQTELLLQRFNYLKPHEFCKALQVAAVSHLGIGQYRRSYERAQLAAQCALDNKLYKEFIYSSKIQAINANALGEFVESIRLFLVATKYIDRVDDDAIKFDLLSTIANHYTLIDDYESASYYMERAKLYRQKGAEPTCMESMVDQHILKLKGSYKEVLAKLEKSRERCHSDGNNYEIIMWELYYSDVKIHFKKYDEALAILADSQKLYSDNNIDYARDSLHLLYAKAYLGKGELDRAREHIDNSANELRHLAQDKSSYEIEVLRAQVSFAAGEFQQAAEFYAAALELKELYLKKLNSITFAVQKIEMNALQQENQVKEAQALQQAQEAQLMGERNRSRGIIAVSFAIVIGLLGMFIINRRMGRSRDHFRNLAHFDPITRGMSRIFWLQSAAEQCAKLDLSTPISVLIIKVDGLRGINLKYGYGVGDDVLARTSQVVDRQGSSNGLLGRLGGNQLALLLPGVSRPNAEAIAEQIRLETESIPPEELDVKQAVTVSIGVCGYNRQRDLTEMILRADRMLDEILDGGGNQVQTFKGSYA
ncbi:diguanylate cyclase (GGDEF) domain-containing protein [Ferrimonas sediminum]|uniref:diguanylate cyclase n=1 Tax=Ferrimonas sediminum TaxID=718193 RepID=A0A1G8UI47_9GAMM|nr:GGDEF domain-containing protein [Ferrimonas sediminum]SDJ53431.1 diguanylate cyclase (GGDEF) domain-containing protein [Ferrimonas sediminum]